MCPWPGLHRIWFENATQLPLTWWHRLQHLPTTPDITCLHHHVQGAPGSLVGSSLFLPQGAVGVFDLPSTWAVVQSHQFSSTTAIDRCGPTGNCTLNECTSAYINPPSPST
jgi:hypothetical protein